MNRRKFISKTSAGMAATLTLQGCWSVKNKLAEETTRSKIRNDLEFRDYRKGKTLSPIKIVTPKDAPYMHTFYDVSPFSPSGRYILLTRLPYQYKSPTYGDKADVCIIDMQNRTIYTVYSTKSWGHQLGTNAQWGNTDKFIYTNDWIDNHNVCVRIDIETGETKAYTGSMYHISPDTTSIAGFPLDIINATQGGYGSPENPQNLPFSYEGSPENFGLFQTDLKTNLKKLLVPLSAFNNEYSGAEFNGSTTYLFHTKYNPQGNRIMQVVRCLVPGKQGWNPSIYTFDVNGQNMNKALGYDQWNQGGHHPNWHPDGKHIIMNLNPKKELGLDMFSFVIFNQDGSNFKQLSKKHKGGGHPSVTPDTKWLITDAYTFEKDFVNSDGEVKIRLIDLVADEEQALCHVYTPPSDRYGVLRNDPHPVWSRDYKKVLFCGTPAGKREIFVANLENIIK